MNFLNLLNCQAELTINRNGIAQATVAFNYSDGIATVHKPIYVGKEGRIKLYGVYWPARSCSNRMIAVGEHVRVLLREGLTLLIEPIDSLQQLSLFASECTDSCHTNAFHTSATKLRLKH